jgi:hypothetical protein
MITRWEIVKTRVNAVALTNLNENKLLLLLILSLYSINSVDASLP